MTTISAQSIRDWLNNVLAKDKLEQPNGRPLFQYHITDHEYQTLRQLLRQSDWRKQAKISQTWCAAFCFYCAEWYRRECQGNWSWDGIHDRLGFVIDANDRGRIIEKGLQSYWRRHVVIYESERRNLLGSLFREGGLPFALLSQEGNRFQSVFRQILNSLDDAKSVGESPIELVKAKLANFPQAFTQDTTAELIVSMADQLLTLIDAHKLSGDSQPADRLDENQPGWRNAFPIPLDGQHSNEFLAGLLKTASRQRAEKGNTKRISCEHWIAEREEFGLIARVQTASAITLDLPPSTFKTARVEIFIYEGNSQAEALGTGHVRALDNKVEIILGSTSREFCRHNIGRTLYFTVMQGGQALYREPIPGTDVRINDLPAVFCNKDNRQVLVGTGSARYKAESLLVIAPQQSKFVVPEDDEFDSQITVHDWAEPFAKATVRGLVNVLVEHDNEQDQYRVSSRSTATLAESINLVGPQLPYLTRTGNPVYLGVPTIQIGDHGCQTWVGGKLVNSDHIASDYGKQTVKVKTRSGITIYHKRLDVLPPDFSLALQPSEQPNQGEIHIHCTGNFSVNIGNADVNAKQVKQPIGKRLELTCPDMPPLHVDLEVRPNLLAEPVVLALPFPSRGVQAFAADGSPLPRKLSFDQLLGARLQLFPRFQDRRASYTIDFVGSHELPDAKYHFEYQVSDKPLEVNLYEFRHYIQSLLAASGDLDDQIRMQISGDCKSVQYIIGRYKVEASTMANGAGIQIYDESAGETKPQLIRLSDPAAAPKPLTQRLTQGVGTGCFEFLEKLDEPSLIVPAKDSPVMFRARFVPPSKSASHEPATSLQAAVTRFHRVENPEAFVPVLDAMVKDFDHSGWDFLTVLFEKYGYLPLSTFETWKQVSQHSQVLSALVYRMSESQVLISRLQEEFNVMWELLPISAWQQAQQGLCKLYASMGLEADLVPKLVASKESQLKGITPYFDWLAEAKTDQARSLPLPMLVDLMPPLIESWQQELLRAHADDTRWPTHFTEELEGWLHSQNLDWLTSPSKRGYQKAVAIFPIFAAALVAEKASFADLIETPHKQDMFLIRQLLDYDRRWFESVFKLALTVFSK